MWFINSCKELRQHFPCEQGCALELGPDVPNYVQDPKLSTFHQCLVCVSSCPNNLSLQPEATWTQYLAD